MHEIPLLKLKPREERRLKAGHHWIYSNEIDTKVSSLKGFSAGESVVVEDSKGRHLGLATMSPQSLICARLYSRDIRVQLDAKFIEHRLFQALALRQSYFSDPCYRAFYGDSDGLSGLVIDRFYDVIVVQITTAGMELVKEALIEALETVFHPKAIVFKNDNAMRELEGLKLDEIEIIGQLDDWVALRENGVDFFAPICKGQKTGWFYDHRQNRALMQQLVKGKTVLDLFSYVGGWGVQAAVAGAEAVTCVDSSELALEGVRENSLLNQVENKVQTIKGNAFEVLSQLKEDGAKFDFIVLDPPAFIKRKKDQKNGFNAYRRINELALRLVNVGGILVSASCSMHLADQELTDILRGSSRHIDRQLQIIHIGGQGADHPIHPAIPETKYLKSVFCRVINSY
ncbi:MAG: class I SAM-dependent rRNA methyltransferase [Pseudomonadales bacterium]|nr:class I SAM-dependent rRNA methyltransferase [Pseudomonadales bacterium]